MEGSEKKRKMRVCIGVVYQVVYQVSMSFFLNVNGGSELFI